MDQRVPEGRPGEVAESMIVLDPRVGKGVEFAWTPEPSGRQKRR